MKAAPVAGTGLGPEGRLHESRCESTQTAAPVIDRTGGRFYLQSI